MIRMNLLAALFVGFSCSFASAQVFRMTPANQLLAKITCDDEPDASLLSVTVDDGVIQKVRFDSKEESRVYTVDQITNSRGIVLVREKGYDAILMKAVINMPAGKGQVVVQYLSEAITKRYSSCNGLLFRANNGAWHLLNRQGQPIREMTVITSLTGIRTITGICD